MVQRKYEKSIEVGEARPTPDLLRSIDSLFRRHAPDNPLWICEAADRDGTVTAESVDELLKHVDLGTVSSFSISVATTLWSPESFDLSYSAHRHFYANRDAWTHHLSLSGTNETKVLGVAAAIEKQLQREFNIPVAESEEFIRVEPSSARPRSVLPSNVDHPTNPPRGTPPVVKPEAATAAPPMAPVENAAAPQESDSPLLRRVLNSAWMVTIIGTLLVTILLAIGTAVTTLL